MACGHKSRESTFRKQPAAINLRSHSLDKLRQIVTTGALRLYYYPLASAPTEPQPRRRSARARLFVLLEAYGRQPISGRPITDLTTQAAHVEWAAQWRGRHHRCHRRGRRGRGTPVARPRGECVARTTGHAPGIALAGAAPDGACVAASPVAYVVVVVLPVVLTAIGVHSRCVRVAGDVGDTRAVRRSVCRCWLGRGAPPLSSPLARPRP
jgi:hypothetical protein